MPHDSFRQVTPEEASEYRAPCARILDPGRSGPPHPAARQRGRYGPRDATLLLLMFGWLAGGRS